MTWQPHGPFNDLPEVPPARDLESKQVLEACVSTRAALAELNAAVDLPNPAIPINTLPV